METNNEDHHESYLRFRLDAFGRRAEPLPRIVLCGPDQDLGGGKRARAERDGQNEPAQGRRRSDARFNAELWLLWHREHVSAWHRDWRGRPEPEVPVSDAPGNLFRMQAPSLRSFPRKRESRARLTQKCGLGSLLSRG